MCWIELPSLTKKTEEQKGFLIAVPTSSEPPGPVQVRLLGSSANNLSSVWPNWFEAVLLQIQSQQRPAEMRWHWDSYHSGWTNLRKFKFIKEHKRVNLTVMRIPQNKDENSLHWSLVGVCVCVSRMHFWLNGMTHDSSTGIHVYQAGSYDT